MGWVVSDFGAVFKHNCLLADNAKVDRVYVSFRTKGAIAVEAVEVVGSDLEEVGNWRVVDDLLEENLGAVFEASLIGFTKDRVQWLIEKMRRVNIAQ